MLRDEEHNAWTLRIDDRASGYSRIDLIGPEFVTSGEFRTLVGSYAEVSTIVRAMRKGPIEVRVSDGIKAAAEEAQEAEDAAALSADEKDALGAIGVDADDTGGRGRGHGGEERARSRFARSTSSSITSSRSAAKASRSTATRASAK